MIEKTLVLEGLGRKASKPQKSLAAAKPPPKPNFKPEPKLASTPKKPPTGLGSAGATAVVASATKSTPVLAIGTKRRLAEYEY